MMISKASSGVVCNILSKVNPAVSRVQPCKDIGKGADKLTVVDYVVDLSVCPIQYASVENSAATVQGLRHSRDGCIHDFLGEVVSADISGNFGDLGTTPGHSHGTYTATGEISAPILQIARVRGQNAIAEAQLITNRAQFSDQVQQVNADVRDL